MSDFFNTHQKKILNEIKRVGIALNIDNIELIIHETSFEVRSKKDVKECPYYEMNPPRPCHDISDLSCFLCGCPEYDMELVEGGCNIGSSKGFMFEDERLPAGKIWDCTKCTYPHSKDTVREYLLDNMKRLKDILQ